MVGRSLGTNYREKECSVVEAKALEDDCKIHPQKLHNHKGEPIFDHSQAKQLLCEDIKNGKNTTTKPAALQQLHPEYQEFDNGIFQKRTYQKVCCQKFVNHLNQKQLDRIEEQHEKLEKKQANKKEKRGKAI